MTAESSHPRTRHKPQQRATRERVGRTGAHRAKVNVNETHHRRDAAVSYSLTSLVREWKKKDRFAIATRHKRKVCAEALSLMLRRNAASRLHATKHSESGRVPNQRHARPLSLHPARLRVVHRRRRQRQRWRQPLWNVLFVPFAGARSRVATTTATAAATATATTTPTAAGLPVEHVVGDRVRRHVRALAHNRVVRLPSRATAEHGSELAEHHGSNNA